MKLSWNTLDISQKLPWNTFETSLKHSWNFLEVPFKLPLTTIKTPLKHPLTTVKSLWHSLMHYDIPNALQTPRTLKEKKGTHTRKHENTNEPTNWVTTSLLELLIAAKKHFNWLSQRKYDFLDLYPRGSTIIDMFSISNSSKFGPRGEGQCFF